MTGPSSEKTGPMDSRMAGGGKSPTKRKPSFLITDSPSRNTCAKRSIPLVYGLYLCPKDLRFGEKVVWVGECHHCSENQHIADGKVSRLAKREPGWPNVRRFIYAAVGFSIALFRS